MGRLSLCPRSLWRKLDTSQNWNSLQNPDIIKIERKKRKSPLGHVSKTSVSPSNFKPVFVSQFDVAIQKNVPIYIVDILTRYPQQFCCSI